jgi:putative hemolysin
MPLTGPPIVSDQDMLRVRRTGPAGAAVQCRDGLVDPAGLASILAGISPSLRLLGTFAENGELTTWNSVGETRTPVVPMYLVPAADHKVELRIGTAIDPRKFSDIGTEAGRIEYLRWRTGLLANRADFRAETARPFARPRAGRSAAPIEPPVPADALAADINQLDSDRLLARSGDMAVYVADAGQIPHVLAEIGRLRETTFRAAGEGTGGSTDLDVFDEHYQHLFVWNATKTEVVGAYRLASTDIVLRDFGLTGLYTATLFRYQERFLKRMGPALELGRSFVRSEYQRGFAPLLLLWKGIGAWVARYPRYRVLFGPVSISTQYQAISRDLIAAFLEMRALLSDWMDLVSSRNPFRSDLATRPAFPSSLDIEDLSDAVSDIEPSRVGVPVLLRQYLKLGGKLLGFNVDPNFSDTLDGLILVDLTQTEPRLLQRYLGKQEAEQFLAFQKGTYGT